MPSVDEVVEQLETSYIASRNAKWYNYFEKLWQYHTVPYKIKHTFTTQLSKFTLRY